MERFYKRGAQDIDTANNNRNSCLDDLSWEEEIKYDPGLRKQIDAYHPNHREKARRKYLENGPCQPRTCNFPVCDIGDKPRRFIPEWFDEFGSWIEYSESKDRAYCFCCFLFTDRDRLNQDKCLQRPGDTRWSSHYKTFKSLVNMFPTIVEVLKAVEKDDRDWKNRDQASNLLVYFKSLDFAFCLHLMLTTLTATNALSLALQRKDQDIVNAIGCVKSTRLHLNNVRRDEWDKLLDEVNEFRDKREIDRVEMEDTYIDP